MTFEERRRMADLELWKMLSRTFPGLVRNVRFEHYDAGGWWYNFRTCKRSPPPNVGG